MTTMSLNAGSGAMFPIRDAARAMPVRKSATPVRAADRQIKAYVQSALAATGRFGLALLPFSLLAWIFIAN